MVRDSEEADVVREIFRMYESGEWGIRKIADYLNGRGIKAKRGGEWHFKSVRRILSNPIYTGRIVSNKTRTEDFLSGTRVCLPENEHIVTFDEKLRIISDSLYESVQDIIRQKSADKHRSG